MDGVFGNPSVSNPVQKTNSGRPKTQKRNQQRTLVQRNIMRLSKLQQYNI